MTKKELTYTIKIIGSKQDVKDTTIAFEQVIGINGIKRMTGIKPSSDPDQYFRFIEAYSWPSKITKAIEQHDALITGIFNRIKGINKKEK